MNLQKLAAALTSLASGIALPSTERDAVIAAVEDLAKAAAPKVVISKADIDKSVKTVIGPAIEEAVKAALATHEARIVALEAKANA